MTNDHDPEDRRQAFEYNEETGAYHARYDSLVTPPSVAVVLLVAGITGTRPTQLDPLHDDVDPNALDLLLARPASNTQRGDVQVTFTYLSFEVTVYSYGSIELRPLDPENEPERA
jgi:hypothetical protein